MILHVDMDAFYASVEQRDRPELRGKPVIVGGSAEGRGVVCAASYEARKFGVHSAMPAVTARRLCPSGIFLPIRMSHYVQIAKQIKEIFDEFTPLVEPLSLDEAFLDVGGCEPLFGPAPEIARRLKERIKQKTDLVASVGVAANKFLAKLASDASKPDGLLVIEDHRIAEFLSPLPVGRIWGVGKKAEQKLQKLGIQTIGDLAAAEEEVLVRQFGDSGRQIRLLAQGIDERQVVPDREAKSISTETTFPRDISDREILRSWLLELVEQLGQRIRQQGVRARTIELKVRSSSFETRIRSMSLSEPTNVTEAIWKAVLELFEKRVPKNLFPVRLLGVGGTDLVRDSTERQSLFEDEWQARQKSLDSVFDAIRARYGSEAIRRGAVLNRPDDSPEQERSSPE
jgi:DNA polymerase IV